MSILWALIKDIFKLAIAALVSHLAHGSVKLLAEGVWRGVTQAARVGASEMSQAA